MSAKILIVDDEPEVCTALKEFLGFKGFDALTAGDGPTAIHILKEHHPPIVLLDVIMPGMNGVEVLKAMKTIDPSVVVIMVTAVLDQELGNQLIQAGAYDYITKPVDLNYLDSVLMVKLVDVLD